MSIDPETLPPQRTVLEAKYSTAPFRVMRLVQRPDQVLPRATFYAGTEWFLRAVRLARQCEDRCVVVTHQSEVIFDNDRATGTE